MECQVKLKLLSSSDESIILNCLYRIAQHENDHLNGVLFTDIMNVRTLKCTNWEKVNDKRGRLVIPFYPK